MLSIRAGRSKFEFLEVDSACLQFQLVENVVENVEERIGGVANCRRQLPLVRRHICFEQQRVHPDDTVHRRADFVAHCGEESGLRLAGLFGLLFQSRQFSLGEFVLGDVLDNPDPPDYGAVARMQRFNANSDIARRAVRSHDPIFARKSFAGRHCAFDQRPHRTLIVRMHET